MTALLLTWRRLWNLSVVRQELNDSSLVFLNVAQDHMKKQDTRGKGRGQWARGKGCNDRLPGHAQCRQAWCANLGSASIPTQQSLRCRCTHAHLRGPQAVSAPATPRPRRQRLSTRRPAPTLRAPHSRIRLPSTQILHQKGRSQTTQVSNTIA